MEIKEIQEIIKAEVRSNLIFFLLSHSEYTEVRTGGAEGTDRIVEEIIRTEPRLSSITLHQSIKPAYNNYPKNLQKLAPLDRNTDLADWCHGTLGFFEYKSSNGTFDTINKTVRQGKKHYLIRLDYSKWFTPSILTNYLGKN